MSNAAALKLFDNVILSVNDDPAYYNHLPLVSMAWRKFFPGVKIKLAFLTDGTDRKNFESYADEVVLYPEVPGVPSANAAKMLRWILASEQGDKISLIHDIDTIPLQSQYWIDLMKDYVPGKLLTVGADVYRGTPHDGKVPASSTTASGDVFKKLFNPKGISYYELFQSWIMNTFDEKENVMNPKTQFSDESLIRALIHKNLSPDEVIYRDRRINTYTQWIDRSDWHIEPTMLKSGQYIEANLHRSFDAGAGAADLTLLKQYIY